MSNKVKLLCPKEFKEMFQNQNDDKLYLIDINKKKEQECNIYGDIKPKFNFFKRDNKENSNNQLSKVFANPTDYISVPFTFDGYSQFSSPRENLFFNLKEKKKNLFTKDQYKEFLNKQAKIQQGLTKIYTDSRLDFINPKKRSVNFLNIPIEKAEERKKIKTYSLQKIIKERIDFIQDPKNRLNGKNNSELNSLIRVYNDFRTDNSYKVYNKALSETKNKHIIRKFNETKREMFGFDPRKNQLPVIIPEKLNSTIYKQNEDYNKTFQNKTFNTNFFFNKTSNLNFKEDDNIDNCK